MPTIKDTNTHTHTLTHTQRERERAAYIQGSGAIVRRVGEKHDILLVATFLAAL